MGAGPLCQRHEAPAAGAPHIDANVYDGETWIRTTGRISPLDVTRLQLKEHQFEDLADLRDPLRDNANNGGRMCLKPSAKRHSDLSGMPLR